MDIVGRAARLNILPWGAEQRQQHQDQEQQQQQQTPGDDTGDMYPALKKAKAEPEAAVRGEAEPEAAVRGESENMD